MFSTFRNTILKLQTRNYVFWFCNNVNLVIVLGLQPSRLACIQFNIPAVFMMRVVHIDAFKEACYCHNKSAVNIYTS